MSDLDHAFVHVVSGPQAARFIEEALRQLGRREPVFAMRDWLSDGPLQDIDAGAASRRDWYKRINPELTEEDLQELDESDIWAKVRSSPGDVMIWHGPHPAERLFALRACWHLRDQPQRVYEVDLGVRESDPSFTKIVAVTGPKGALEAWERRANVADVSARAKRWEELRDQPGDWIRALNGENIVQHPVTEYDGALLAACERSDWTDPMTIIGKVSVASPLGFSLLTWRIRELLRAGTLEARGEQIEIGLPAEVRPTPDTCSAT
jgi:hypothetical protein